jgi:hypothetical protein
LVFYPLLAFAKILLIQYPMTFPVQTSLYKFLFILLGLADGHLLWADATISPAAALKQPIPACFPETRKDGATGTLATPAAAKPRPLWADEAMPATMIFRDVPVAMVAHIVGRRLGQKVEVETNATHLISGDFGHLSLNQALHDAAAKAGLVVIDEGKEGLHLVSRDSLLGKVRPDSVTPVFAATVTPIGKSAVDLAAERQRDAALKAADEKRIDLLKLRAKLLLEEPDQ